MLASEKPTINSFNKIGQKICAHLLGDGSWADTPLQAIILQ